MFVLLDAENVLEHVVELFLGENHLRGGGRLALRTFARVVVAAKDLIELRHPRAENSLLAQAVDLGQTPNPLLDVILKHLQRRYHRRQENNLSDCTVYELNKDSAASLHSLITHAD